MKKQLSLLLVAATALLSPLSATAQDNGKSVDEAIDINMKDTPVDTLILSLAKMAGINVQIDNSVYSLLPTGERGPLPKITIEWKLSPRQALTAVVENQGWQATLNPETTVTTVKKKDPAALEPLVVNIVPLRHAHPTNTAALIKSALLSARSQVQADVRTSTLIISSTKTEFATVSNLLARIDSPSPQILIEARFVETTKNPSSIRGIDWAGTLAQQNIVFGNGRTTGTTTTSLPGSSRTVTTVLPSGRTTTSTVQNPIDSSTSLTTALGAGGFGLNTLRGVHPATAFLNADGVSAVLSFLNSDSDSETVANPRAVAMEGQQTELSVIRNIPVFEAQLGAISGGGAQQPSAVKPNYSLLVGTSQNPLNEVGIKLIVTPRIVGTSTVQLDLKPEISSVDAIPARVTLDGRVNESPIFARRKLQTIANVPDRSTLVIGGLVSDEVSKVHSKIPLLGDIPVIGLAFRQDGKSRKKSNLLIFVTPSIISDGDYQPNHYSVEFLKTKIKERVDVETPAIDTGKPLDKSRSLF